MPGHLQDTSGLPSVSSILDDKGRDLDEAFQEEAKTALQNFLQVQLKIIKPFFFFFTENGKQYSYIIRSTIVTKYTVHSKTGTGLRFPVWPQSASVSVLVSIGQVAE